MNPVDAAAVPEPKKKRWPVALLVGLITAIAAAVICAPVADWATQEFHVSNMEGGRGMLIACIWIPLAAIIGFAIGFAVSFFIKRTGFAGYAARQGLALLAVLALAAVAAGITYLSVDHPPLIDGQNLALEIEVRVPTKGRSLEQLQTAQFTIALTVSASDRSYSDLRWAEATRTEEFITVPAWAPLNSKNASREITAGIEEESRQIFNVLRTASPKKIDDAWSEWEAPRQRFDGSKPTAEDQYLARYRVRFASEYLQTPTPSPAETPTPPEANEGEANPEPSATP